ncbi:MAG: hypothetical protein AAFU38_10090 [Bacteroidota bacterium]
MPVATVVHEGQTLSVDLRNITLPDGYRRLAPGETPDGFHSQADLDKAIAARLKQDRAAIREALPKAIRDGLGTSASFSDLRGAVEALGTSQAEAEAKAANAAALRSQVEAVFGADFTADDLKALPERLKAGQAAIEAQAARTRTETRHAAVTLAGFDPARFDALVGAAALSYAVEGEGGDAKAFVLTKGDGDKDVKTPLSEYVTETWPAMAGVLKATETPTPPTAPRFPRQPTLTTPKSQEAETEKQILARKRQEYRSTV